MRKHRPDTSHLEALPAFRHARRRSLESLAAHTDVLRIPAGRTVIEAGRPATQYVALVAGEAVAHRPDGETTRLAVGTELGADALVDRRPYDRTVVTCTDATFVVVDGRAFRAVHPDRPDH